jgi:hypothetical protein
MGQHAFGSQLVDTPPTPLSHIPEKDLLRILIVSDLHIPLGTQQKDWLLQDREWLDTHDWAVLLGDMTACYGTPGEYQRVNEFITQLARPYSVVNGNHEFSFDPCADGSAEYGKRWEHSSPEIQRSQLQRFEAFYRIETRFMALRHPLAAFCLLGVDAIGEWSNGMLNPEHESWLEHTLDTVEDLPLLVFCHFPLFTSAMSAIRYYEEGRKPCYIPPEGIRHKLAGRAHPTFWFSGHVHFRPPHPLVVPYFTEDRVWQVHCPDSWGFGRPNNENWHPEHYQGLFVRSIELGHLQLRIITTDLVERQIVSTDLFDLNTGQVRR